MRPWFLPRSWQLVLKPSVVARTPLLAADHLGKPSNPLVVNSVRLSVPDLDLYAWRDRSKRAGTAHTERYEWSSRNSCLGPIDEKRPHRSDRVFFGKDALFPLFPPKGVSCS